MSASDTKADIPTRNDECPLSGQTVTQTPLNVSLMTESHRCELDCQFLSFLELHTSNFFAAFVVYPAVRLMTRCIQMASDIFAKIGDIKGESLDDKHKDEIEVLSFSWGVTNAGSIADRQWRRRRQGDLPGSFHRSQHRQGVSEICCRHARRVRT